ncbi:MAG: molybdopterin-dependent oxidoreductase [Coriobacteriales bacterium]|nr:molybdopterin-dependent oxidoreductase [Coriobacteriales bacterium]
MKVENSSVADQSVIKSLGWLGFGGTCNTARVDSKDGRIVRIRPLHYDERYTSEELNEWCIEKDGKQFKAGMKSLLPPLSLAYKTRTYSPNRVPYPLIRSDWDPNGKRNPQNRGKSKYRRISWDQATDIIASEIKRIHDAYGPFSVYCQGEGHGEAKNYNGAHGCQTVMLFEAGGCTVQARQPDSWEGWYWGAKHMWGMEPVGVNGQCTNVIPDITKNGDAVLFWGCDPETTPWGWGGLQPSRICYWFNEVGIKSIFICPDVNYAAAVHADRWVPVLPNTDAALQLGIAHVWLTEGSYDKDYLETHAIGFDWFESYVLGGIDGVVKTPSWAAEKCGIPSYRIKALARYWASHNVSIAHCNGGGYIRSAFSHEPARLEVALLAMQAIGHPGRHQFRFIEWNVFGEPPVPPSESYTTMANAYNGFNFNLGDSFITKTKLHHAILDKRADWWGCTLCMAPRQDQFVPHQYPLTPQTHPIHMIWSDTPCFSTCWNGGFLYEDAMRDESIEFILVQHPWMENDTLFADIILPIATLLECYDLGNENMNGQYGMIYIEDAACEPVGEATGDHQAVCEIARKLERYGGVYQGLLERYTGGMGQEEKLRYGYEHSGAPHDLSYDQLREQGFWASPIKQGWETDPAGMINFYEDPESFPLQSPTGKIEFYSTTLAEKFPEDKIRAPYPQWIEETDEHHERIGTDRAREYPFLLVSNHPRWRVHAEHDDMPWTREIKTCKVVGPDGYAYEPVWIHPSDARQYGIVSGDVVKLFNERGTVLGGAYVTERIMPGALYQDHGARVDFIRSGFGGLDRGGANNLIAPDNTTSPNVAGEVTNGFLVGLDKADVFALAEQHPQQFSRPYDPAVGLIAQAYIEGDE